MPNTLHTILVHMKQFTAYFGSNFCVTVSLLCDSELEGSPRPIHLQTWRGSSEYEGKIMTGIFSPTSARWHVHVM